MATAPAPIDDFAEVLEAAARALGLRKGPRTRLRLLAATARLLAGAEPGEVTVAGITGAAGVALGTFYRYFPEREAALDALLGDFADFLADRLAESRAAAPGGEARVLAATATYARLFRVNAGLMRCLLGLDRASARWASSFRRLNRTWNGRVATALAGGDAAGAATLLPTAYALGGMVDEFLTTLYLRRDPALAALRRDEAAVAALLAGLWSRLAARR